MWHPERLRLWLVTLIACVCLTPAAFGLDDQTPMPAANGDCGVLIEKQTEDLFMQVPAGVPPGKDVLVEFVLNGRVIASQNMVGNSAGHGVVKLLAGSPEFMRWLRSVEAMREGAVMIQVKSGSKQLLSGSLTRFEAASLAIRNARTSTPAGKRLKVTANTTPCQDNCDAAYQECQAECGQRGSTECDICTENWMNCENQCCNEWQEVSRTLIGKRFAGTANIVGFEYCIMEEHYTIEETNPAGCYGNRTRCVTDTDWMLYEFPGDDHPTEQQCCNANPTCGGTYCP